MTGLAKKLLSFAAVRGQIAAVGRLYINFVFRTTRWKGLVPAVDQLRGLLRQGPIILCVWHGRQLMMPKLWPPDSPLWVLGSTSRDGQLALAAAGKFNIKTIDRSRNSLDANTARRILQVLCSGDSVGLTPDGSRGPRMRVKAGVIRLAKLSGAPLVPATYSCSNAIQLSSWDRFVVPLPFARGIFTVGTPVHVGKAADTAETEKARSALEHQLNAMTEAADRFTGGNTVLPENGGTDILQT